MTKDLPDATEDQILGSIHAIEEGKKEVAPVLAWYVKNTKISAEQIARIKNTRKFE
jgi:hypothetical protein